MNNENKKESKTEFLEEEISIKPFINILLRKKIFLFLITLITSIFSVFYSNSLKPVYRGNFEILVSNTSNNNQPKNLSLEGLISGSKQGDGKTQELILKSQYILFC